MLSAERARAYLPLLAVLAVQGLLIALMPSTVADSALSTGGGGLGSSSGTTFTTDASGEPVGGPDGAAAGGAGNGGTGGTPTEGTDGTAGGTGGTGPGGPADPTAAGGDTSHCSPDGRQFALVFHAPPCRPVWTGTDNGGATAQGVTATTVRIALVLRKPNPVGDPILASQGLGITAAEAREQAKAATEYLNANLETYGRTIEMRVVESSCDLAPTDVPCYRELGRAASDTFAVILVHYEPPEFFDEVARNGAVAIGGLHYAESAFESLAPFRYDVLPNGTIAAKFIAEYYCKKLAGAAADHAGSTIHPTIGSRSDAQRRLGIFTVDRPPLVAAARDLANRVEQCSGEKTIVYAGPLDAASAQQQVDSAMARMISERVTTIVPLIDPVALAIVTSGASRQAYFPEWLVTGESFIGNDAFARLQDQRQWRHAFGIDFEPVLRAPGDLDATRVWKATGRKGLPGQAPFYAELFWRYFLLAGVMVQEAGPQLHANNVHAALYEQRYSRGGAAESGGRADVNLWRFGPDTGHTANADVREVYWDPDGASTFDGKRGGYVSVREGARYELGQLPPGLDGVPVDP